MANVRSNYIYVNDMKYPVIASASWILKSALSFISFKILDGGAEPGWMSMLNFEL